MFIWSGRAKPVLLVRTDGGSDQQMGFMNTLRMYFNVFKIKF